MSRLPFRSVGSGWQWISEDLNYVRFPFKFVTWKIGPLSLLNGFHVFLCDNIRKAFTFMHNQVFEHSDTLLCALLACIILHINCKQFRRSVFTFVQYITYTTILTWNDIKWFSQPLHIINKLGQFMSILPTVILPRWKENRKYAKIPSNYRKNAAKTAVWNFFPKILQLFLPAYRKVQEKITW